MILINDAISKINFRVARLWLVFILLPYHTPAPSGKGLQVLDQNSFSVINLVTFTAADLMITKKHSLKPCENV